MKTYTNEDYNEWKKDNLSNLQSDWSEFNPDEFNEYCKEQFNLWCDDNE